MALIKKEDNHFYLDQSLMLPTPFLFNMPPVKNKYACIICDYSSNFNSNLKRHVLLKHPDTKQDDYSQSGDSNQDEMINVSASYKKDYACSFCNYSSNLSSNLKRHLLRHSGEKLPPSEPDASTNDVSVVQRSIIADMTPKKFSCDLCEYASNFSSNLKRHMLRHKTEKDLHFEVEYDRNPLMNKQLELEKFVNCTDASPTTDMQPYICTICGYATAFISNLKTHMLIHENKAILPAHTTRNIEADSFPLMITEEIKKNSETKDFPLMIPEIKNKKEVKSLPIITGEEIKNGTESKSFHPLPAQDSLISKKKAFNCTFCTYSSMFSSNMKRHTRTVHSDRLSTEQLNSDVKNNSDLTIESYTCSLCNYSTKLLEIFNVHLSAHSSSKFSEEEPNSPNVRNEPCVCLLCDCPCDSKFTLKNHLEVVHDIRSSDYGLTDTQLVGDEVPWQKSDNITTGCESTSKTVLPYLEDKYNLNQLNCDLSSHSSVVKSENLNNFDECIHDDLNAQKSYLTSNAQQSFSTSFSDLAVKQENDNNNCISEVDGKCNLNQYNCDLSSRLSVVQSENWNYLDECIKDDLHKLKIYLPNKAQQSSSTCFSDLSVKCENRNNNFIIPAVDKNLDNYKPKKLKCTFCLYFTDFRVTLLNHLRIHFKKIFSSALGLTGDNQIRIKKIRSDKHITYHCAHCSYNILNSNNYKSHLRSKHPDQKGLWSCLSCNYSTVSELWFYSHALVHKEIPVLTKYKCTVCLFKTNFLRNFKIHKTIHLQASKNLFQCNFCSYSNTCELLFNLHRRLHIRSKFHKCPHCPFVSLYFFIYQNHLKLAHDKSKIFTAGSIKVASNNEMSLVSFNKLESDKNKLALIPLSSLRLNNNNTENTLARFGEIKNVCIYENHQKRLDNNCYKVFACNICDYFTPYSSNLKRHLKKHTSICDKTLPGFNCEFCSYSSSNRSNLKRHLRMHTGERLPTKTMQCSLCSYSTSYKSNLKRHLKMHAKEQLNDDHNSCKFCSYNSSKLSHLQKHLKLHEEGETLQCNHCNFNAKTKFALNHHKLTHLKFSKQCLYCNNIFTNPRAYQCHMDQFHNEKMKTILNEEKTFASPSPSSHDQNNSILPLEVVLTELDMDCVDCTEDYVNSFERNLNK